MDTPEAWAVVAAAFQDRGRLTDEREVELGVAFTTIGRAVTTSLERIADAMVTISGEPLGESSVEAESYRQMHATARELGYSDILDALEATPPKAEAAQ